MMLDKYKTEKRKEVEKFFQNDNPFGSYNSFFGGMDVFMNIMLVFFGATLTLLIWYSLPQLITLPIFIPIIGTIILWVAVGFMIFKSITDF